MRVLIDLDEETLQWAAIKAAERRMSRKKFLAQCIIATKLDKYELLTITELPKPNIQFIGKLKDTFKNIVISKLDSELDKIRDEQSDMSHLPKTKEDGK
jgi:hypothetical protein